MLATLKSEKVRVEALVAKMKEKEDLIEKENSKEK